MIKDRCPANGSSLRRRSLFGFLYAIGAFGTVLAGPLPSGADVAAGSASVATAGAVMTVRQTTDRAVVNWDRFSIAPGHAVNFAQPSASSVILNRVVGGESSLIQGALTSNGHVFLLNPNGILFAPTAQVSVGGIVASTLAMADADFLAGRYALAGTSSAAVINEGNIVARRDGRGGFVLLVAAKVVNEGAIKAEQGSVILAAAGKVTINLGGRVSLKVEQGTLDALVVNGGAIIAPGGDVLLVAAAAADLPSATVNQVGIIEAQTLVTGEQGSIRLMADMQGGVVRVSGRLDVSAPAGGDGGFIETSAGTVAVADGAIVSAFAPFGQTGRWLLDPDVINIAVGGAGTLSGLPATGESTISPTALNAALSLADVDLQAKSHIDFRSQFTYVGSRDAVLGLYAPEVNLGADLSSASAKLSLNFGGVYPGNSTNYAGNVYLYDAATGATTTRTLMTNGGSVVFNGNLGGSQNFTIFAGAGSVTHNGLVDGNFNALATTVSGSIWLDFKPGHPDALVLIDYTTQQVFSNGVPIAYTGTMPVGFIRIPAQVLQLNAQNSVHGTPVSCVFTLTDGSTVSLTPLPNGHVVIPALMQVTKVEYYTANASAANFAVNPVTYDTLVAATKVHQYVVKAASVTLGSVATVAVDGDIAFVAGRFVNHAGMAALTPGPGLTWRVWSSNLNPFDPSTGDEIGGLVYDYKQYDLAYTLAGVGLPLLGGNGLIYTFAPHLGVSLVGSITKPYDGLATAANISVINYAVTGAVGGDTVTLGGALPSSGTYSISHDVGSGLPVMVTGLAPTLAASNRAGQAPVYGYRLSSTSASGNVGIITPVGLTISTRPASKTYDGQAYAGGNGVTYVGFVNGETVAVLNGTLSYAGSSQGARNVGSYALLAGGLTSGNYTVIYAGSNLTISKAGLTISANPASKTYDGQVYAGGNGVAYNGFVPGETSSVLGGTLGYTGSSQGAKNVGSYGLTPGGLTSGNYAIIYAGSNLTVGPAGLTISANPASKTYDGQVYAGGNGVAYNGFVPGETPSVLGGTLGYTGSSQGAKDVGSYGLTPGGLTSGNYAIIFAGSNLTVGPAGLTISANPASKTYDGQLYAGGNGVTYNGFVPGETSSVLGGTLGYTGSSQGAKDVGSYGLTPGGLTSGNYAIIYAGSNLTVGPAGLTISANPANKTYDGQVYAGGNGVTYNGFVPGETPSVLGGTLTYAGSSQGAKDVGSYGLTPGGLTSGNYAIIYAGSNLTVGPAGLTISANPASKTYDGQVYAGGNGVTYSGFVPGETPAVLGGSLTYGGAAQGAKNPGSYALNAAGLTSGNYVIQYVGNLLTIEQGANTVDPIPWLLPPVKPKPFVLLTQTLDPSSPDFHVGGLNYVYVDLPGLISAAKAAAYARLEEPDLGVLKYDGGALLVRRSPLVITSADVIKIYDTLAYAGGGVTYADFIKGETAASLGGKLAYGGTSQGATGAGTYTKTATGQTSANYDITYIDGTLLVKKAPLTITSSDEVKVYDALAYLGGAGVTYLGLLGAQRASALGGVLAYGGTAQGAVGAGTYTLTASGQTSPNYDLSYVGGRLLVSKAPLEITSAGTTKVYDALAYLGGSGVTYLGLLGGQTSSVLGGKLVYGGTSQGAVGAGSYTMTASGQTSPNYELTYVGGTLLVNKAALMVTSSDVSKVYDAIPYVGGGGVIYSGLVGGQTSAVLGGTLAYGGSAQGAVMPGTYVLIPRGYTSSNYAITYRGGTLTIKPAGVAVAAAPPLRSQVNPDLFAALTPVFDVRPIGPEGNYLEKPFTQAMTPAEAARARNAEVMLLAIDAGAPLDVASAPRLLRPTVKVRVIKGGVNLGKGVIIAE